MITNKCPNDENIFSYHCLDCDEKFCLICFKKNEKNNLHKNHNIINILDYMPSSYQLDNFKEKISKKLDALGSLIKSLDEWQNE